MNQKIIIIFALISTFLICGCSTRQWEGEISGKITDDETEEPIVGVIISARSMKNSFAVSTISDSDGNYRVRDARWGPNEVYVYHPKYSSQVRYADVIRDKSVSLDFELALQDETVSPEITFWVTRSDDSPIENARLDLYESDGTTYSSFTLLSSQLTDSDGRTTFYVAEITEDYTVDYRAIAAVLGFLNQEVEFTIDWNNAFLEIHLVMESV